MKNLFLLALLVSFNLHAHEGETHSEPPATVPSDKNSSNVSASVPPAIAPAVNNSVACPMVMQGSKAASIIYFSVGGTGKPEIVPLCVAWYLGQKEVVERMTCKASKEYSEANPACESLVK